MGACPFTAEFTGVSRIASGLAVPCRPTQRIQPMFSGRGRRGRGRGGGRGEGSSSSGRGFGRSGSERGGRRGRGPPRAPRATGDSNADTQEYVAKWTALVELELSAERAAFEERINNTPDHKLQAQGLVLLGVKAQETFADPTGSGQTLARLDLPASAQSRRHNFMPGDFVLIRSKDQYHAQGGRWEGVILDISGGSMRLELYEQKSDAVSDADNEGGGRSLNNWPADELGSGLHVRVDKGSNRVAFDRQLEALECLKACQDTLAPGPPAAFRLDEEEQYNLTTTWVRDVVVAPCHRSTEALATRPSFLCGLGNTLHDSMLQKVACELGSSNATQQAAIGTALSRRLALIQGPPGTGKTTTTAGLVWFAKNCMEGSLSAPVLVCAQSNTAVDKLVEELLARKLHVVRLGNPTKIQPDLLESTMDHHMKSHPKFPELQQKVGQVAELTNTLSKLHNKMRYTKGSTFNKEASVQDCRIAKKMLQKEIGDLRRTMKKDVLAGAQVVCSTCIGAGSPDLKGFSFPLLVLDEGSQASEPEALVPIMKGTHQVIIVGDHKQLPPTIMSSRALAKGLGVSLFERMMEAGVPSTLLGVQYRAHPLLFEFPSTRFYSGAVQSGVSPEQRPQLTPPFPPLQPNVPRTLTREGNAAPVVFINLQEGQEAAGGHGKSKVNEAEAQLVQQVVRWLQRVAGLAHGCIGVVSPYAAQVELLKQKFLAAVPGADQVQVASVDGFQGREKEVIVFSTVRSNNADDSIGFLRDPRRLNVAITRAKRLLVVVGNKATLTAGGCPHWTAWMEYLEHKGWVLPAASLALS
ncbi:AAA domain-containing protein [Haematococcus lacustris]